MRGVFARRDFRAGEFLLSWNGVKVWADEYDKVRAERAIPNEYDVSRYEVTYQSKLEKLEKRDSPKLITCPPLRASDGLPILPEHVLAHGDASAAMASTRDWSESDHPATRPSPVPQLVQACEPRDGEGFFQRLMALRLRRRNGDSVRVPRPPTPEEARRELAYER